MQNIGDKTNPPPLPGESWLWTYTIKTLSEQEMKSPSTNREEGRRGLE